MGTLMRRNIEKFQLLRREIPQINNFSAGLFRDAPLETLSGDYQVLACWNLAELVARNNLVAVERKTKFRLTRRQKNCHRKMMRIKVGQRVCNRPGRERVIQRHCAETHGNCKCQDYRRQGSNSQYSQLRPDQQHENRDRNNNRNCERDDGSVPWHPVLEDKVLNNQSGKNQGSY